MKTIIFGAQGNLGQDLVRAFTAAGHDVVGYDRETLDVTDADSVRKAIAESQCDVVVNSVAYNDVDGAEDPVKRPLAFTLNAEVPEVMAKAAWAANAAFVQYSTDYVFEGTRPDGYAEDEEPHPLSAYGESKAAGERAIAAVGGKSYVVRTSKLFGRPGTSKSAKPSFVAVMCKLAKTKPELSIVNEEYGMPTYTKDLAEATVRLVSESYAPGIYHLVNEGPSVTWYGFAEEFFGLTGANVPRKPVPMSAFPRPAKRPLFAPLKNTKFPPLRNRIDALKAYFEENPEAR